MNEKSVALNFNTPLIGVSTTYSTMLVVDGGGSMNVSLPYMVTYPCTVLFRNQASWSGSRTQFENVVGAAVGGVLWMVFDAFCPRTR